MKIQPKFLVGFGIAVATFGYLGFTAEEWGSNTIGYATVQEANRSGKMSAIKGYWIKEKETEMKLNTFTFYMQDEAGETVKVLYRNGEPNNFEEATSIVVKGTYENGVIYAKDILVKCPSKYQSEQATQKKS